MGRAASSRMTVVDGDGAWPERTWFTTTDLRQFVYCARVVFFTYCQPLLRPETHKMQESHVAHTEEAHREARRSLRRYGVEEGRCEFDVTLRSGALGLTGRADLVVRTSEEVLPVEYKNTFRKPGRHWALQVAAYGLMLEEMGWGPVHRGLLYAIPTRAVDEVSLTARRLGQVRSLVAAMREMVEGERMPEAPVGRGRCVACEFRRFCNDL